MATPTTLPVDWAEQNLPIFRVYADQGSHPPVALNRPVCVIGRDYDANLPLESPQVSEHQIGLLDYVRVVWRRAWLIAGLCVLSVLATLYPSWRASRLDPVEALRYQ